MFGPHWDDNLGYGNSGGQSIMSGLMMQNSFRGNPHGDQFLQDQQKYGIIPRSIEHLFQGLQSLMNRNGVSYTVYCSFLQIYNEKLFDLF